MSLTFLLPCFLFVSVWFPGSFFLQAQDPDSSADDRRRIKNVVLIVSDDLKASVLGCYGDRLCKTPNLDRLAKRSLVFDRAYCQGTWCAPSRTSFMFSQYKGVGKINLGQHLRKNGFYSARVGKIYHMRVPGDIIAGTDGKDIASTWTERFNSPGKEAHTPGAYACLNLNVFSDSLENRQSTAMPHRMFVSVICKDHGRDQPDYKSASKAIELLKQERDQPFFLAVGLVRPHYPMVAPKKYFDLYPDNKIQMPEQKPGDLDDIPKMGKAGTRNDNNSIGKFPDNQKKMWSAYYASVSFMDEQVGRILDELEKAGLADETAIIFTSDHGYHLGEHGFWQKSNLHEEVTRVPLMISVPGLKPGKTKSLAELVDLFPTISDLVGLDPPKGLHGKSLVPVLQDHKAAVREGALSIHKGYAWRTADWSYMQYNDGTEELYDMQNDPNQFENLANQAEHSKTRDRLKRQLSDQLKRHQLN